MAHFPDQELDYLLDGALRSNAELAETVAEQTLPAAHRMLACHCLLERLLAGPRDAELPLILQQPLGQKLVGAALELLAAGELLPAVPVKMLWCLIDYPEAAGLLRAAGVMDALFGVLRAAEVPALGAPCLGLLAKVVSADRKAAHGLFGQVSNVSLLLRLLLRWHDDLEAAALLLQIFEAALHVPGQRRLLCAQVQAPQGGGNSADEPIRLPAVLGRVAKAAAALAAVPVAEGAPAPDSTGHVPWRAGIASTAPWHQVAARAQQLATEWQRVAELLGCDPSKGHTP